MNNLLEKQKQLMAEVPHDVSPGALVKMAAGVNVIDTLLRFLNSTGHKPWRPIPLSPFTQQHLLKELKEKVDALVFIHRTSFGADHDFSGQKHFSRQIISVLGIIEESIEYIDSVVGKTRAEQLEEITDVLFFFLESMILGDFSWKEVEQEYHRKWKVNIDRYRRAKEGDYTWDKRGEKGL